MRKCREWEKIVGGWGHKPDWHWKINAQLQRGISARLRWRRERVSDTRTEGERILATAPDRFKVMVHALPPSPPPYTHTHTQTHLHFHSLPSHFPFPPRKAVSLFAPFYSHFSHPLSSPSTTPFLHPRAPWFGYLSAACHTHTHTRTHTPTNDCSSSYIWLCQFVSLSRHSPICHPVWQDLIDWPAHLSFFQSLTLLSNLHISIRE